VLHSIRYIVVQRRYIVITTLVNSTTGTSTRSTGIQAQNTTTRDIRDPNKQ
jgi:hypothetical protein